MSKLKQSLCVVLSSVLIFSGLMPAFAVTPKPKKINTGKAKVQQKAGVERKATLGEVRRTRRVAGNTASRAVQAGRNASRQAAVSAATHTTARVAPQVTHFQTIGSKTGQVAGHAPTQAQLQAQVQARIEADMANQIRSSAVKTTKTPQKKNGAPQNTTPKPKVVEHNMAVGGPGEPLQIQKISPAPTNSLDQLYPTWRMELAAMFTPEQLDLIADLIAKTDEWIFVQEADGTLGIRNPEEWDYEARFFTLLERSGVKFTPKQLKQLTGGSGVRGFTLGDFFTIRTNQGFAFAHDATARTLIPENGKAVNLKTLKERAAQGDAQAAAWAREGEVGMRLRNLLKKLGSDSPVYQIGIELRERYGRINNTPSETVAELTKWAEEHGEMPRQSIRINNRLVTLEELRAKAAQGDVQAAALAEELKLGSKLHNALQSWDKESPEYKAVIDLIKKYEETHWQTVDEITTWAKEHGRMPRQGIGKNGHRFTIEELRAQAAQGDAKAAALAEELELGQKLERALHRWDKESPEYKAVVDLQKKYEKTHWQTVDEITTWAKEHGRMPRQHIRINDHKVTLEELRAKAAQGDKEAAALVEEKQLGTKLDHALQRWEYGSEEFNALVKLQKEYSVRGRTVKQIEQWAKEHGELPNKPTQNLPEETVQNSPELTLSKELHQAEQVWSSLAPEEYQTLVELEETYGVEEIPQALELTEEQLFAADFPQTLQSQLKYLLDQKKRAHPGWKDGRYIQNETIIEKLDEWTGYDWGTDPALVQRMSELDMTLQIEQISDISAFVRLRYDGNLPEGAYPDPAKFYVEYEIKIPGKIRSVSDLRPQAGYNIRMGLHEFGIRKNGNNFAMNGDKFERGFLHAHYEHPVDFNAKVPMSINLTREMDVRGLTEVDASNQLQWTRLVSKNYLQAFGQYLSEDARMALRRLQSGNIVLYQ